MCRIAGILDNRDKNHLSPIDIDILVNMRDSMINGGPDGCGIFSYKKLGLAHRRLAIIDLSEAGKQPMTFGNWTISFNGEIYNYQEIKSELINYGYNFMTDTDTEVIVMAYDKWGNDSIAKFRGMFAFSLWNQTTEKLILCRDRLGVKPLHWYLKDNLLLFSSEIKAFFSHPAFDKEINLTAIPHFLKKGYIEANTSIFKFVNKVEPGSIIEFDMDLNHKIIKYWDLKEIYKNSNLKNNSTISILNELESTLIESFKYRMVSDVPVGIFLSGGIDSALIASILQKNSDIPINTYTIGFSEKKYDESEVATKVAKILGTQHKTFHCTEDDFREYIDKLPFIFDEPFGDSSAIPTCLVCKLARNEVKVVLSGDGGDELFGGYSRYQFTRLSTIILRIPLFIRKIIFYLSHRFSGNFIEKVANIFKIKSYGQISNKYSKLQNTLLSSSLNDFYERASSYISLNELEIMTNFQSTKLTSNNIEKKDTNRFFTQLGVYDMLSYLPGDILTKVDRASMFVGLEAREPFLDQKIIDFSLKLNDKMKYSNKENGKYILKLLLKKYLPDEIIYRPKQGFSVPIDKWMRSLLKNELTELKNNKDFFKRFNLNMDFCNNKIELFFKKNDIVNPHQIWFLYVLYTWYKQWVV